MTKYQVGALLFGQFAVGRTFVRLDNAIKMRDDLNEASRRNKFAQVWHIVEVSEIAGR